MEFTTLARVVSARRAGELLHLPHREIIRRIRRGDIKAQKLDWNWLVPLESIDEARESEWYQKSSIRTDGEEAAEETAV